MKRLVASSTSSSNSGSALPANLDPCGYLTNTSWLQNTVQISQLARLNCSLTSLHEVMPQWLHAMATSRSKVLLFSPHMETLITTSGRSGLVRSGPVRSGFSPRPDSFPTPHTLNEPTLLGTPSPLPTHSMSLACWRDSLPPPHTLNDLTLLGTPSFLPTHSMSLPCWGLPPTSPHTQ